MESRLTWDQPAASTLLRQPYKVHQMVHQAFPDGYPGRILWHSWPQGEPTLLVRAPDPGDWLRAVSHLYPPAVTQQRVRLPILPGQVFSFRLLGNPLRRSAGKEFPCDWREWLHRQMGRAGSELVGDIDARLCREHRQPQRRGEVMHQNRVAFAGQIEVIDPTALAQAMVAGVGRGRGFGCGMLRLR